MRVRRIGLLGVVLVVVLVLVFGQATSTEIPFGTEHTISGGFSNAQAAVTGDIDGDGDNDVVGAAQSGGFVWWENDDGSGTSWTSHTISLAIAGAIAGYPVDMDSDGDLDVLGAAIGADDVVWFENADGVGTAWNTHNIDTFFDGVYAVNAVDLDGDGDLDVAGAASSANEVTWWENDNGAGTSWTEHLIKAGWAFADGIASGDIDGDGDNDLVAAAGGANEIRFFENTAGDGSAWSETVVQTGFTFAHWVDVGDVDGDGDLDVMGVALNSNRISWFENTAGDGSSWTEQNLSSSFTGAHTVHGADMDADGDMDIAGVALNGDQVTWWENTAGDGSAWTSYTIDGSFDGAHSVATGDVDGDGDLDVLGTAANDSIVVYWENETIHRKAIYPEGILVDGTLLGAASLSTADINGDGNQDLLAVTAGNNNVAWWDNASGDGSVWNRTTVDTTLNLARSVTANDVDGDGDMDMLVAGLNANLIVWYENDNGDGSAWTRQTVGNLGGAFWVAGGDIDGDGDVDAMGAGLFSNTIAWYENDNGDGSSWTTQVIDNSYGWATSVSAVDMDRDGDMDILGSSYNDDEVTWWENAAGDGSTWTEHVVDTTFDGAVSVYGMDIDGDGDVDIAGAANLSQEFAWWENVDGAGTVWTKETVGTGFGNAESVYLADLDADGDVDILGAAQNVNTVAWWEQTSTGWNQHLVTTSYMEALQVFADDLDGDGDLDMAAVATVDNELRWWPNEGGQFGVEGVDSVTGDFPAGTQDDLLTLTFTHNGRDDDSDVELVSFDLLLEEAAGDALTSGEANALIANLHIYLDDGSGVFEEGNDALVTSVGTLSLAAGVQTITLADGDSNVHIAWNSPETYFVVAELTANADTQTPNQFRITHLADSTMAEDAMADIPLSLAYSEDNPSSIIVATEGSGFMIFLPITTKQ